MKRVVCTFLLVACGGAQSSSSSSQQVAPLPLATSVATTSSAAPSMTIASPSTSTSASARDAGASSPPGKSPEMIVIAMRADLRRCYNRAVKNDPNLRAAIRLTIDVAPDGSVTKVTPHSTPPVPNELEQCLIAAASKVAFDPPGGNGATFELPINLVPANP